MTPDVKTLLQCPKIDVHCHVWHMDGWEESSDHLVESGQRLGISEMWISSPIMGGQLAEPENVQRQNDTVLAAVARHPKHLRGWAFVIAGHWHQALTEAQRCLDAGMIGIKLYNQYRLDDPVVGPILELASQRRVPILQHAGYLNPKDRSAQPLISWGAHFAAASQRYPDARLIHAHIGGGGDWEYSVRSMRQASPKVYIDISGSNLDDGQVEFAVAELGPDRVLFGTDGSMAGSVGKLLDTSLTPAEREKILWSNAARLLADQGATPLYDPGKEDTHAARH